MKSSSDFTQMSTSRADFMAERSEAWRNRRGRCVLTLVAALLLGCTGMTSSESHRKAFARTEPASSDLELTKALAAVARGRYSMAEPTLARLASQAGSASVRAQIALAEVELMTGRNDQAIVRSVPHCRQADLLLDDACSVLAEALRRNGDFDRAISELTPHSEMAAARRARLDLAELLSDRGRASEARLLYRRLVEDFTAARVPASDAKQLAITGRAAHRLGALKDANEFYDRAAMTGLIDLTSQVWRGELVLAAHDPDRAQTLAEQAMQFAPDHPTAQLFYARVRLATMKDAEQAEQYAQRVLATNPRSADPYAILTGLALHDLDFVGARRQLELGLEREPRHLELLSLRAVAAFLADDHDAFDAAIYQVLRINPSNAKVYRLVAEYAGGEHRYEEAIPLLRRAIELDPADAVARAQLGLQLLRFGDEPEGRRQLDRAFKTDPFDLRVRNTLVLFEQKIDREYVTLRQPGLKIRLPIAHRGLLQSILPDWIGRARSALQQHYGRLPRQTLALELYGDQDSFGVRTSGVPATFLQGVCFGHTIVARLPTDEPTNLGMTLWHELAHVYHLAISRRRVPRWFTEGLAEVETARYRPEWVRKRDRSVYAALRDGRIPRVAEMNRAYSRASSIDDLALAYVTSTYLVDYLVQTYGFGKMREMLVAWGERQSTERVVTQVLATNLEQLDTAFRATLRQRLAHFEGQYVPPSEPNSSESEAPGEGDTPDPKARALSARAALLRGQLAQARKLVADADSKERESPDLLWVSSMIELADQKSDAAESALHQMIVSGHDGYFVRLQLALVARLNSNLGEERDALARAQAFDPAASEPLYRLAAIANAAVDSKAEVAALEQLARLEESDARAHRRLVELHLQLNQPAQARRAAEALEYVDVLDPESHALLARVALATRDRKLLIRELGHQRDLLAPGDARVAVERVMLRAKAGETVNLSQ